MRLILEVSPALNGLNCSYSSVLLIIKSLLIQDTMKSIKSGYRVRAINCVYFSEGMSETLGQTIACKFSIHHAIHRDPAPGRDSTDNFLGK